MLRVSAWTLDPIDYHGYGERRGSIFLSLSFVNAARSAPTTSSGVRSACSAGRQQVPGLVDRLRSVKTTSAVPVLRLARNADSQYRPFSDELVDLPIASGPRNLSDSAEPL